MNFCVKSYHASLARKGRYGLCWPATVVYHISRMDWPEWPVHTASVALLVRCCYDTVLYCIILHSRRRIYATVKQQYIEPDLHRAPIDIWKAHWAQWLAPCLKWVDMFALYTFTLWYAIMFHWKRQKDCISKSPHLLSESVIFAIAKRRWHYFWYLTDYKIWHCTLYLNRDHPPVTPPVTIQTNLLL